MFVRSIEEKKEIIFWLKWLVWDYILTYWIWIQINTDIIVYWFSKLVILSAILMLQLLSSFIWSNFYYFLERAVWFLQKAPGALSTFLLRFSCLKTNLSSSLFVPRASLSRTLLVCLISSRCVTAFKLFKYGYPDNRFSVVADMGFDCRKAFTWFQMSWRTNSVHRLSSSWIFTGNRLDKALTLCYIVLFPETWSLSEGYTSCCLVHPPATFVIFLKWVRWCMPWSM